MTEPFARLSAALADRYRLSRELGAGGMATVYLAEDLKHDRQVAIKVLRPDLAATLGPERFLREVKIAAALQHPHVLPLYDSGQADGFLYYVMPYVEGTSLRQKLVREGELPVADAVRILRDLADAMAYAHAHGVVHRDIKPENVMLSGRHALVTDFGVAKAVSEATGRQTLTTAGVALGTPTYMAPEQAAADPHTDYRADIYAFGVVAYELLAGRPPFIGTTPQAVLAAHVTTAAEPVTAHRASIPPALAALVMKCLEKKPADRWQRAEELIVQLEAVLTPSGGTTPTATQPITAASPPVPSRRPWLAWVVGAAALVIVAVGALWFTRRPKAPAIERFAVIPFENRTGNPAHAELGAMVADWVTRGLVEARLAEVVPTQVVAAAMAKAKEQPGEALVSQVARETGATKLVTGAYYAAGDSLRFQAELIDPGAGKSLAAVQPVTTLPAATMAAIDSIRRRVLGSLALAVDSVWGRWARTSSAAPPLEAFRLFVRGIEAFWRDAAEGERLVRQALAADRSFLTAAVILATILDSQGRYQEADSVIRQVELRDPEQDTRWTRWIRADLGGDRDAAYRAFARDSTLLGDGSDRQQFGFEALKLNRPREALRTFSQVKPRSFGMSGIPHFWNVVAEAHHMLGDHEAELAAIHQGREQFPRSFWLAKVEAATLAALGRHEDLARLIEEARNLPPDPWGGSFGTLLLEASAERAAHGDSAGAAETANQAVAWYAAQSAADRGRLRYEQVLALYQVGRAKDAAAILPPSCPASYEGLPCLGWTALVALWRGDTSLARRTAETISGLQLRPRLTQCEQAYWLATVAVAQGQLDLGLERLRESFAKGYSHGIWLHRDPLLAMLHAHPGFTEILRPKG